MAFLFKRILWQDTGLTDHINLPTYMNLLPTCGIVSKDMPTLAMFIKKTHCHGMTNADKQCSCMPKFRNDGMHFCGIHNKVNQRTIFSVPVSLLAPKFVIRKPGAPAAECDVADGQVLK
jgi:hypothetical protein